MSKLDTAMIELAAKIGEGKDTLLVHGEPYGVHYMYPAEERKAAYGALIFAEDACGNWLAQRKTDGRIVFIDHEIDEITVLSESIQSFVAGLSAWSGPELEEGQVKSVWIAPEFLKEIGGNDT